MKIDSLRGSIMDIGFKFTQYEQVHLIAADFETPGGELGFFTMASEGKRSLKMISVNNVARIFFKTLKSHTVRDKKNLLYFHNAQFDIHVLLAKVIYESPELFSSVGNFYYDFGDVQVEISQRRPIFGTIFFEDREVLIRDTMNYFGMVTLDSIGQSLDLTHKKLHIDPAMHNDASSKYNEEYQSYCMEDTLTTFEIAKVIDRWHKEYDLGLSVSAANMSMMLFRARLFDAETLINCPDDQLACWEASYHGGKNVNLIKKVCLMKHINVYDIRSAYPYAMTRIPSFTGDVRYKKIRTYSGCPGILEISGVVQDDYAGIYLDDFTPVAKGEKFSKIWITSYEYDVLTKYQLSKNFKIHTVIEVLNCGENHPLRNWAEEWYKKKNETPKTSIFYNLYKIGYLNSLYGKFIQKNEVVDTEYNEVYLRRAGHYHAPIASLITGHARAQVMDAAIRLKAYHIATDSIFTDRKMPKTMLGTGLGKWSEEALDADWLCFGSLKRYILKKGDEIKYAKAGFHGDVDQLEEAWHYFLEHDGESRFVYKAPHMLGLLEYLRLKDKTDKNIYSIKDVEYSIVGDTGGLYECFD